MEATFSDGKGAATSGAPLRMQWLESREEPEERLRREEISMVRITLEKEMWRNEQSKASRSRERHKVE